MFFFYKQSKFWKQAGACLWKKLVQAQSILALCLFIKILLGVCLRKRLDQARNMIILEKLLYKMCCCCDTDYNIIGHLASSERHLFCCIFDESEGKCFAILNRKNHSMEKFMLVRKMLNIIVSYKAQHMLKKITKPESVYAYYPIVLTLNAALPS